MLKRFGLLAVVLCGIAQPALAQQTVNFTVGYFAVRGEDARVQNDVINQDRTFLTFDVKDFNAATAGAEWLIPIGNFLEAGAGVSYSRRTVPSVYTLYVDNSQNEISQDLRLRMVPIALTFRVLPLGQSSPVQPYFGAGLGIINWRYSETGDFIDFGRPGQPVFRGTFTADGTDTGPVVLGGVRFASDTMTVGGEVRYQSAEGEVGSDFAAPKIDLGGWTYQFTVGVRFGR
jgi:opacity protein-like surface antigen